MSGSDDKRQNSDAAAYGARVRRIIGELYSQHLDILLFLTLAFYALVTLKDILSPPPMAAVMYAVDALVIVLLLVIYVLERHGTVNTDNLFLAPIPVAIAMLINGYTHIIILEDPEMLVRGILMTIAFGIVSLLPWIFWLLNSLSVAIYVGACMWLLDEPATMIGMGIGGGLLAYGAFAMRYNSVRSQIELTIENEERADSLARLGKAKDQFIANMSHELRTPLTGLLGMVDLIGDEGLSKEQKTHLAAAKSSANMLGGIIDELLDISKLDAGKIELVPKPFDLNLTAESVVAAMKVQAREGVNLTYVPAAEPVPHVVGDAPRLTQIFFNLVGNALKFTDKGSVNMGVELLGKGSLVKLRCYVKDTGAGIPADRIGTLFDRFEQVDSSSTRGRSGTGLGLAISQDLARLMDSEIHVESTLGEGSRFWFDLELPAAVETVPHAQQKEPAEQAAKLPETLNILVAEDNMINQMLIKKLLEKPGWTATYTLDGAAALEAAEASDFDLILMDIQMPKMSGEEATTAIRGGGGPNKDTPIIAFTANCQPKDVERYKEGGFSDCVGKPITKPDFYRSIAQVMADHS